MIGNQNQPGIGSAKSIGGGGIGYIPLAGTDVGNPVTGDIELATDVDLGFIVGEKSIPNYAQSGVSIDQYPFWKIQIGANQTNLSLNELFLSLYSDNTLFRGLVVNQYYGANYDDNTCVQKKYVDTAVVPLDYGDIVSAGGIENAQVFTTGSGTGIASVDLSPTMAIGKDVTVSDLGNNASTHNIQIDSGVGNTILFNGVKNQDITLNTNGVSVTIRKITENEFIVISKNF